MDKNKNRNKGENLEKLNKISFIHFFAIYKGKKKTKTKKK